MHNAIVRLPRGDGVLVVLDLRVWLYGSGRRLREEGHELVG